MSSFPKRPAPADTVAQAMALMAEKLDHMYACQRADIAELKTDVGDLKADVGCLKADIAELKEGQARLERVMNQNHLELNGKLNALMDALIKR